MKNSLRTTLLTGLAVLSLGTAVGGAYAQTQAPSNGTERAHHQQWTPEQRAQFAAKRAEMRARRTAQLHDALKITPAQESAWNAFVASMQPPARHQAGDRAAWAQLSAPERMAKRIELQKQRTARMESRQAALNTFYSVLTPDQKQVFDQQAARMHGRGHGGHGGFGGHGERGARGATAQG